MLTMAQQEGIPAFDLWKACEGDKPEAAKEYLLDGLHLNAKWVGHCLRKRWMERRNGVV
jgi:hypothetical protein